MTRHLVRFGLYLVIGYSLFGVALTAQTPSKEYIRVNGRVVAIESTASGATGPAWWNNSWTKRRKLTILKTQVAGPLTDFPVAVVISDAVMAGVAQASGSDIVFTTEAGLKLSHEIESYNSSTGSLTAWVKVPSLSNTNDTVLYLYYGNSGATDQQNKLAVWNPKFRSVHHWKSGALAEDAALTSTLTSVAGLQSSTGKLSNGMTNNGGNNYAQLNSSAITYPASGPSSASFSLTLSTWFKTSNPGGLFGMTNGPLPGSSPNGWVPALYLDSLGKLRGSLLWTASTSNQVFENVVRTDNNWHFAVVTIEGGMASLFVDGQLVTTLPGLTQYGFSNNGYSYLAGSAFVSSWPSAPPGLNGWSNLNGSMDETRILNEALTPNWIRTEFNNQNTPSQFYTIGSPESGGTGGVGGSVTISGSTTNLAPYSTRVLTATVTGVPAGQDTVRWSVVSVPSSSSSNGLISTGTTCVAPPASMTYRAPSTITPAGNIVLKAESCQNASWSSTISIPAAAATSVTVTMSPKPTTVNVSQTFTALVSNADTPGVTWSLSPASAGTITSAGIYTVAAGYTGNATITARSIENTAVSDPHTFAASSSAPAYQSSLVSFVMPSSLTQGAPFTSTITMQNPAGAATWDTSAAAGANQVVIASQTPANNLTWRTNTGTTTSTSVPQNSSAVFTVTGRAPVAVTGIQTFDWQMRQGSSNWFGPIVRPAASVSVGAGTRNSQLTQFTAPATVNVGETFNATVIMQNTGSATWWSAGVSGTNPFRLKNTGTNPNLWVTSLMQLPTEYIDNAQSATFTIPATAPDDPGPQTFAWQMEQSGLGTFGAIASRSIEVKSLNPAIRNVTPTSGNGLEQLFSAKFIGGQAQAHTMRFHFWPNDGTTPHCWAEYNQSTNQIIIYNSSTGIRQIGTPGVINTIQNEYCYVKTGESTVNIGGNVTQVSLKIGFKSTISGTKNFYVSMVNTANVDTGWLYQGAWVIPQQVLVTVSPTSALLSSGQSQQFTSTVTGSTNTAVSWNPFGWGSVTSGGLFTASTVSSTQNTILRATSQADTSRWADANLTIQPAPVLVTITNFSPQNGSGRYATFNVSANGGNSPISNIQFYANTTQLNTGGCLVTWYPSSNYVTLTWNGGYYTQGGYMGTASYLSTSYCTINLQASFGSTSGNNATMNLNLSYAGWPHFGWISHYAKAANNNSIVMADWQYFGYWYLP
jgi:hypothetical protein